VGLSVGDEAKFVPRLEKAIFFDLESEQALSVQAGAKV
jgi:hypothetical protein